MSVVSQTPLQSGQPALSRGSQKPLQLQLAGHVAVGVADGVLVGAVGVSLGVADGVSVGVAVGVSLGVSLGVEEGVSVGVTVGVGETQDPAMQEPPGTIEPQEAGLFTHIIESVEQPPGEHWQHPAGTEASTGRAASPASARKMPTRIVTRRRTLPIPAKRQYRFDICTPRPIGEGEYHPSRGASTR
jgi:hypothetical protein